MANKRILVAGIGNIFLGDDAFGCEVAQRLFKRAMPQGVRVVDFGIRGFDLAYALLENYELSILIDATPRGGAPGTLYVIEVNPNLDELEADELSLDTHAMNPLRVLGLVKSMGGQLKRILIVGCEPSETSEQDEIRLSESVWASLDKAVELVESLIARHLDHCAVSTAQMQPVALT
ncbi:MAG: hydrogenase maturation protease [Pyrinomonadaceae bacterium]